MDWKMVAAGGVIALVAGSLVHTGLQHRFVEMRRRYVDVLRAIRAPMLPIALVAVAMVIAVSGLLMQVPILRWGWWQAIGGSGNVVVGQSEYPGIGWRIAAFAIPLAVVLLLPALALFEENSYRRGSESETWAERLRRQLMFGLMHLAAGIPIAIGLALTVAGLMFMWAYLREFNRLGAPEPPSLVLAHTAAGAQGYLTSDREARDARRQAQDVAVNHAAALHTVYNALLLIPFVAVLAVSVL
ncbi:hypothetical protein ACT17_32595 [Mycolicibacterium conceptionense]|uniref:Uncharacterized protein n=1 Tax=Mycolicibacterium conceptionense TaxID=451644 RepID=A0A0J8TWZ8_9MYCO|nr:hypothetical protein [Mycolicibacterium conceptionense]KMV13923.1 hypothetical protein ACT17_32595 [Mycolicibacterium conceptionense]